MKIVATQALTENEIVQHQFQFWLCFVESVSKCITGEQVGSEPGHGETGWFELGHPPEALRTEAPPIIGRIQPKEGRMLIFPGYFFHNSILFASSERDISIAWDLIAEA